MSRPESIGRFVSAVSGGSSVPAYPTISGSRLWLSRNYGLYSDTSGTAQAVVDGTVASWRAIGDSWGTDLLTQSTSSLQPTLRSNGLQINGTDDYLTLPSPIAFTGAFTVYFVGFRTATSRGLSVCGNATQGIYCEGAGAEKLTVIDSVGTLAVDTAVMTSLRMLRIRRTTGGIIHFKEGGVAEKTNAGTSTGTLNIDRVLTTTGISPNSTSRYCQVVLINADIGTGSASDLAVIAKLASLEPTAVSL